MYQRIGMLRTNIRIDSEVFSEGERTQLVVHSSSLGRTRKVTEYLTGGQLDVKVTEKGKCIAYPHLTSVMEPCERVRAVSRSRSPPTSVVLR